MSLRLAYSASDGELAMRAVQKTRDALDRERKRASRASRAYPDEPRWEELRTLHDKLEQLVEGADEFLRMMEREHQESAL
jgi:hypothetical protein